MVAAKVLIPMADYGHDPTETAIPFIAFKKAGFLVTFATETGKTPECDKMMLEGMTQKLLGATAKAVSAYHEMATTPDYQHPISWSDKDFSLEKFDLVFLPGGHQSGVRQLIDSDVIHKQLLEYFPNTKKGKGNGKCVAAICHGVMVLSETLDGSGKSVLKDVTTTALPGGFESVAFWGTRVFLGDYYKTYGVGSENVEDSVKKRLENPEKQWKSSLGMGAFVVEDEKYNYVSGRFPNDAKLLAERTIKLVESTLA